MNASFQFQDKYVFYSPSITTGVSFVLDDIKQTQFIYMSNNPLITPISFYQMSCRTRNMDKLIYFSGDPKPRELTILTLKDLEIINKNLIKCNEKILTLSRTTNENDDVRIVENTFFKLYCYNQFQDLIFWTGFLKHYHQLLINNGFILKSVGNEKNNYKFRGDINAREYLNEIKQEEFDIYLKLKFPEEIPSVSSNIIIENRRKLLNIGTSDDAKKYKIFLTDEYALRHYFNTILLLRNEKYITKKYKEKSKHTYQIKLLGNIYNKIKILKEFETHYKIDRFGLDLNKINQSTFVNDEGINCYHPLHMEFDNFDMTTEISDEFKEVYLELFSRRRSDKYKYDSKYELIKVYINMIKNIFGDIPIVKSKRGTKGKKEYQYYLDVNILIGIVELIKLGNSKLSNFNQLLIEKITLITPTIKEGYNIDTDEDDNIEKYLFNKIILKNNIKII